jgi:hypothetical protein
MVNIDTKKYQINNFIDWTIKTPLREKKEQLESLNEEQLNKFLEINGFLLEQCKIRLRELQK